MSGKQGSVPAAGISAVRRRDGSWRLLQEMTEEEVLAYCDNLIRELETGIAVLAQLGEYGRKRWGRGWRSGSKEWTSARTTRYERARAAGRGGDARVDPGPDGGTDGAEAGEGAG